MLWVVVRLHNARLDIVSDAAMVCNWPFYWPLSFLRGMPRGIAIAHAVAGSQAPASAMLLAIGASGVAVFRIPAFGSSQRDGYFAQRLLPR